MPKAYPVYDANYAAPRRRSRHLGPISNLQLVGRNGMHKYNNQDHSMLTAMMAVANLRARITIVWSVNTDFEYHEPRDRWELIVVDDASADDSALIAADYADVLVRLPGKPRGPAYARNRGSEVASGSILVFVDADVCVHPEVLTRFDTVFRRLPWISGAFGSYDAMPAAPGIVSRFRNLLHHYVHQTNPGEAETFWSGCGAVRRDAFVDVDMFDEWHYSRPEIEDIDIGRRMRRAGHRIVLRPEIQCTHLKRWTLKDVLHTDISRRGVPWMRAILQEQVLAEFQVLNLRWRERVCGIAALMSIVVALLGAVAQSGALLMLAFTLAVAVALLNLRFYRFLWETHGVLQVLGSVPLHFLFYVTAAIAGILGYAAHLVFGEPSPPPDVEAETALGLDLWPPCPRRPVEHLWRPVAKPRSAAE
jgi:cellulose synthase/poly-beta-1,6-N-acetylglucosamine synthase-like glycosyltransferase